MAPRKTMSSAVACLWGEWVGAFEASKAKGKLEPQKCSWSWAVVMPWWGLGTRAKDPALGRPLLSWQDPQGGSGLQGKFPEAQFKIFKILRRYYQSHRRFLVRNAWTELCKVTSQLFTFCAHDWLLEDTTSSTAGRGSQSSCSVCVGECQPWEGRCSMIWEG